MSARPAIDWLPDRNIVPPVVVREDVSPRHGQILPPWIRLFRTITHYRLRCEPRGEQRIVRTKYAIHFSKGHERALYSETLPVVVRALAEELSPSERADLIRSLSESAT